jgi:hypothetical protein
MTDDQGWYDVGFNGNLTTKLPNLDGIASNGVIFNRFYSFEVIMGLKIERQVVQETCGAVKGV